MDEYKIELLERSLARAAQQLGDITAPAMEQFYDRYPEAREGFRRHSVGETRKLEGLMVENSLYCLMYWMTDPGQVEIMLSGSVPHHNDTLNVPPEWYRGLLECVVDVICDLITEEDECERAVMDEVRGELVAFIESTRPAFLRNSLASAA